MTKCLTAAVFCAALIGSGSTVAQQMAYVGPGPIDPSSKSVEFGEHAGQIRAGFSNCVYKHSRRKVDALLQASDPFTINFSSLGYKSAEMNTALDMPRCMSAFAQAGDAQVRSKWIN